ncbi:MAG: hypothetical protein EA350_04760 [Gemmatimonadales bacterium]|nr:MAG: hypothetical protein EA350_04760 [Gemmatimonadales bacterium]
MKRAFTVVAVALVVGGCAILGGGITSSDPFRSQAERRLSVRVENVNTDEMTVNALAPGRRHSLGRIPGRSVQQFSIPWASTQDVRFQIEPLRGRRHTTRGVSVGPGESVHLLITQPVERSAVYR